MMSVVGRLRDTAAAAWEGGSASGAQQGIIVVAFISRAMMLRTVVGGAVVQDSGYSINSSSNWCDDLNNTAVQKCCRNAAFTSVSQRINEE